MYYYGLSYPSVYKVVVLLGLQFHYITYITFGT